MGIELNYERWKLNGEVVRNSWSGKQERGDVVIGCFGA
jgi:hypothetical protein